MTNPVIVEVTRGPIVESFHRGSIAIVDCEGRALLSIGDTQTPVYPRSAVKAIQALGLVESGAADAFAFGNKAIALTCSSHSGQPSHIETARLMLEHAGLTEDALECGGHWSFVPDVMREQARMFDSDPTPVWNNCSGKHAGLLCTASHMGWSTKGYVDPDHEAQRNVRSILEDITGQQHDAKACGTDGCSIPTYAIPLNALAYGFAKMATGSELNAIRAAAASRILKACMAEPFYVAGDDRFCTKIMDLKRGRIFAKTGAEGVYCAAIPELGLGIALKCDDGNSRGSQAMLAAALWQVLPDDPLQQSLKDLFNYPLKNWRGKVIGEVKTSLLV